MRLDLDTHDPRQVAGFCLGLGYDPEVVVKTLVKRCGVDLSTADIIVRQAMQSHQEVR